MSPWKIDVRSIIIYCINELCKKKKKNLYLCVGSQIVAHTLMETGNGPNKPNTINL